MAFLSPQPTRQGSLATYYVVDMTRFQDLAMYGYGMNVTFVFVIRIIIIIHIEIERTMQPVQAYMETG